MDAEIRPEVSTPDPDLIDPIGPQELPRLTKHTLRALALTGVAIGSPLIALVANTAGGTPTTNPH